LSEQVHEADFYGEELIRKKLEELWRWRDEESIRDVVFCMCGNLIRNLGNMCNPELHKGRLEVINSLSFLSILIHDVCSFYFERKCYSFCICRAFGAEAVVNVYGFN
jgi:hypothetical protein